MQEPAKVAELCGINVCQIAAGDSHSVALTESGSLYSFGEGLYGKLGHGDVYMPHSKKRQCCIATRIDSMEGRGVHHISCGGQHSLAVTVQGQVYSWGQASHTLGLGNEDDDVGTPTLLRAKSIRDKFVIHADAGGQHSILIAADKPSDGIPLHI